MEGLMLEILEDQGYEQAAHLYDLFDRKQNVPFFCHYAGQVNTVLDVGAGTGRVAFPMAEAGTHVVCIEPSPGMRTQLESKLAKRPELSELVTIVPDAAATFKLARTYPLAILSGSFDHFLNMQERLASLYNIAQHLQPGGLLVFDVFLGLMQSSPLSPAGYVQYEGREYRRMVGSQALDNGQIQVTLLFEVYEEGRLIQSIEQQSWTSTVTYEEIHRILVETGFKVKGEFADYEFTPYYPEAALLVVEAICEK
ncbi:MAG: class I SAM-dependent methyltransferase [Anaerolineae bacterium]|nr:class I SAM-dependent methyltransferase [Anaerolineae bacterium]